MLRSRLPEFFELETLCKQGAQFSGTLHIANERNVAGLICPGGGKLDIKLSFFIDEQQYKVVEAWFKGTVWLECQRCLEPYLEEIESHWTLSPSTTSDKYEPLTWDGKLLDLRSLIEEEVILSLPMIPRHPLDVEGEQNGCSKK